MFQTAQLAVPSARHAAATGGVERDGGDRRAGVDLERAAVAEVLESSPFPIAEMLRTGVEQFRGGVEGVLVNARGGQADAGTVRGPFLRFLSEFGDFLRGHGRLSGYFRRFFRSFRNQSRRLSLIAGEARSFFGAQSDIALRADAEVSDRSDDENPDDQQGRESFRIA